MTAISYLLLALSGAAVIGLLGAERRDDRNGRWRYKTAASALFVLAALAGGVGADPAGRFILAGLVLSALGDVLLIPRKEKLFLAGMGAFAAAHLAYCAAFIVAGVKFSALAALALIATLLLGAALVHFLKKGLGAFRIPVIGYSVIISVMVALSFAHLALWPGPDAARLALAATAFAVSDVSVALDQFKKRSFLNRLWGLPLYYLAQALFALGI